MIEPKWMNESEYTKAVKKEKKFAKKYGGEAQPCSGRLKGDKRKGDVKFENFLVEHKNTKASQYILKYADLSKINRQADAVEKEMALVVEFSLLGETFVVMKEDVWKEFLK